MKEKILSFFHSNRVRFVLALIFAALVIVGTMLWWMFIAGRTPVTLKELPVSARVGEDQAIFAIAQGLRIPWALDFLPDGRIIFTEREGSVRMIDAQGKLLAEPLFTVPDVAAEGEGGLLGIALHPHFSENNFVYLYYTAHSGGGIINRVVRYRFAEGRFTQDKIVMDNIPAAAHHDGGRIAFGPDGMLYITTGDAEVKAHAQDVSSLSGKILRVSDDGSIPPNNPFSGSPVWSYGHRNPQGLAWDAAGRLWSTEHGPSAHDEINLIVPGGNYGWPESAGDTVLPGTRAPIRQSGSDTWAPSGATVLGNTLLFVGLRGQELYAQKIGSNGVLEGELHSYFGKKFGRMRSVTVGPDGFLYILSNNWDGRGIPAPADDEIIRIPPSMLR